MQREDKKISRGSFWIHSVVIFMIIWTIFNAGCSESANQNSMTQSPTSVSIQAKFITGDIIAKTASSTDLFFLILKYDSLSDKYERTFVNKKSDGSWFRNNDKSEYADRSLMEKLYSAKVGHVSSLSLISIETKTSTPTTTLSENIPSTSSRTITETSTITHFALPPPFVMGLVGFSPQRAELFSIGGSNFQSGAIVKLTRIGYPDVIVKSVNIVSGAEIRFNVFNIPCSNPPGQYNIVVINPDGQSGMLANSFVVLGYGRDRGGGIIVGDSTMICSN